MDYIAHYEKSPRMWSQGLHAHDDYEIYLHLSGGRFYCIDDTVFKLTPNQLLIIPPLHMHGLVCDHDLVNYERCFLYLSLGMLHKCGFGKIDLIEIIDNAYKNNMLVGTLSEENARLFQKYLKEIEKDSCADSPANQLDIYSKILKILYIMEFSLELSHHETSVGVPDTPMHDVLHYINEHYTENLTISSIGQLFHLSDSFLSHKFKEYTNKGIYEYILYKRILKAKELMYSNISLTEIAFTCGFGDYSNFLRAFKKITGTSPKEYRRS